MIRLLHIADIHLGKQFPVFGNNATEYRNQLLRTFEKIIDVAVSEKVSLLMIAGDLFDSKHVYGLTIGKVMSGFTKLETSGIRVCIIPGTHDAYDEDSPYRSLRFPQNVTLFTPGFRQREYSDLDLMVYGLVPDLNSYGDSPMQYLSLSKSSKFHVGMAHCSIRQPNIVEKDAMVLDKNEILGCGLDYFALGHWHSLQDVSAGATIAYYSGSPEPMAIDQKNAGNAVLVTLKEKKQVEIKAVRVGTKRCESMNIDISPFSSPDTITKMIEARADINLILEVTLTGLQSIKYDISCQGLENLLGARFSHLRVVNESHPGLEEVNDMNYPDKTVIGRFVKLMEEKISSARTQQEKSLYEEVFKLGFNLLRGNLYVIE